MISLLSGEFYKLKKTRAFYVLLAISLVLSIAGPISTQLINDQLKQLSEAESEQMNKLVESDMNGFQTSVFSVNAVGTDQITAFDSLESSMSGNGISLFFAILAALFIAMEFSSGSMKIILSKGFSRTKVLLAKLIIICCANVLLFFVYVVGDFLTAGFLWEFGSLPEQFGQKLGTAVLLELAIVIAFTALVSAISFMNRTTVKAMVINIFVVLMAGNAVNLLDMATQRKLHLSEYWILNTMAQASSFSLNGEDITKIVITIILTLGVALLAGIYTFRKAEIK